MNKSFIINVVVLVLMGVGYFLFNYYVFYVGLFVFFGVIINWFVIYMLFEKVLGLYGFGVIFVCFEDFKVVIKNLMME